MPDQAEDLVREERELAPDEQALGRLLVAPARIAALVGPEREQEVKDAIVAGLASHRQPDGSYRLENEFHYVVARA